MHARRPIRSDAMPRTTRADPRGHRRPAARLPAQPARGGRATHDDDLLRAAGRAGRGQRRQGPQGPLLPRLLRHPRRRLRRRVPAVPDEPRAGPHPGLARRHRRASATSARRSPTTAASASAASRSPRWSTPTRPRSAQQVGTASRSATSTTCPSWSPTNDDRHRHHRHARRPPPRTSPTACRGRRHVDPELRPGRDLRARRRRRSARSTSPIELQILSFYQRQQVEPPPLAEPLG